MNISKETIDIINSELNACIKRDNQDLAHALLSLVHYVNNAVESWAVNSHNGLALDAVKNIAVVAVKALEEHEYSQTMQANNCWRS
jgi:hypothetical protein